MMSPELWTWFRWNAGIAVITECTDDEETFWALGQPTVHRVPGLALLDGPTASSATDYYYLHDKKGSVRGLRGDSREPVAAMEMSPYGEVLVERGVDAGRSLTFHTRDDETGLLYTAYRYYSPGNAQWISRDPLGMVDGPNLYKYAKSNPVFRFDPLGLTTTSPAGQRARERARERLKKCVREVEETLDRLRGKVCSAICPIPVDIKVSAGGFLPNTSVSPAKGWIHINYSWCKNYDAPAWDWYILHEVGHAVDDFSRIHYLIDPDYRQAAEDRANQFADKCLASMGLLGL